MSIPVAYALLVAGILLWAPLLWQRRTLRAGVIDGIAVFGGAFLLASCFINLVPHMYLQGFSTPHGFKIGAAVAVGFLVQMLLEILTQGAEHHTDTTHSDSLPMVGLLVGLSLHGLIEGMPLTDAHGDLHQGLLYGIVLHNIPITLIVIGLLTARGVSPRKGLTALLLLAVASPLGNVINRCLLSQDTTLQSLLMGVVVGLLLHVSVSILHTPNRTLTGWQKILIVAVAFVAAYFTPGCSEIYH